MNIILQVKQRKNNCKDIIVMLCYCKDIINCKDIISQKGNAAAVLRSMGGRQDCWEWLAP